MRGLFFLLLSLLAVPAFAQTAAVPAPAAPAPAAAPFPRVVLETTAGRIVVEVEIVKAPITAGNFLRYVDHRKLDGIEFYRVSKLSDHFGLVQFGALGDPKRSYPPIPHEPTTVTGLSHTDGAISIARSEPGTARGDFTLMVGDLSQFDAKPGGDVGFAAFGHVVEGMDVVVKILDGEISPTATRNGGYKGEVPVAPVRILTARRAVP